jgi:1-pyrroline-5-carboxylate dehydrogenase
VFTPFYNEPYVNFNDEGPRRRMLDGLAYVKERLGRSFPVVIGGERIETSGTIVSRNPANWTQVVGETGEATAELVDQAVAAAQEAFRSWSQLPVEVRARYLVKLAASLRRRIYEFSAWLVYEASKNWNEAYADVAEAVDFLEFYAREAVRWQQSHPTTPFPGEENEVVYLPLGVGAIIAPWNFPLAILVGMTSAAIVTGNTVVMKPAEQTPVIASRFFQLLEHIGLPPGVVNFLPGYGETVGEALTGHPDIRFVSFTGSREVGVKIYEKAAKVMPGQKFLRRAILEMGGKDAIIVDEGVNLDGAAEGVVTSAFGFQGQKCSACSRLIAHTKVYDKLLDKVVEKASRLTVGDPALMTNFMGAVIDGDAYQRIMTYVAMGRTEGRAVLGGEEAGDKNNGGWLIHPTIFADVAPTARIAQEEIFGPVLSVIRAESFDHALEIANNTDYGLTGGVYSYHRANLEKARREFHVGNLYMNRKITGALVDVQPFGGFNLSGTNSKAGGRDYLGHFLQAKAICERF